MHAVYCLDAYASQAGWVSTVVVDVTKARPRIGVRIIVARTVASKIILRKKVRPGRANPTTAHDRQLRRLPLHPLVHRNKALQHGTVTGFGTLEA